MEVYIKWYKRLIDDNSFVSNVAMHRDKYALGHWSVRDVIVRMENSEGTNRFGTTQPEILLQLLTEPQLGNTVCLHEVSIENQKQKFKLDIDQKDDDVTDGMIVVNSAIL